AGRPGGAAPGRPGRGPRGTLPAADRLVGGVGPTVPAIPLPSAPAVPDLAAGRLPGRADRPGAGTRAEGQSWRGRAGAGGLPASGNRPFHPSLLWRCEGAHHRPPTGPRAARPAPAAPRPDGPGPNAAAADPDLPSVLSPGQRAKAAAAGHALRVVRRVPGRLVRAVAGLPAQAGRLLSVPSRGAAAALEARAAGRSRLAPLSPEPRIHLVQSCGNRAGPGNGGRAEPPGPAPVDDRAGSGRADRDPRSLNHGGDRGGGALPVPTPNPSGIPAGLGAGAERPRVPRPRPPA